MVAATRLATVLVLLIQGRESDDVGLLLAVDQGLFDDVLELASTSTERHLREVGVAQGPEAIATDDGVGQGHRVRLATVQGDPTGVGEPLMREAHQRTRRDGVRSHLLLLGQLDDGGTEGKEPVGEEGDQGWLVLHLDVVQGRVGVQLLRLGVGLVLARLLATNRISWLIQGLAPGKNSNQKDKQINASGNKPQKKKSRNT